MEIELTRRGFLWFLGSSAASATAVGCFLSGCSEAKKGPGQAASATLAGTSLTLTKASTLVPAGATGDFVLVGDFNWWSAETGITGAYAPLQVSAGGGPTGGGYSESGDSVTFNLASSALPEGSYRVGVFRYQQGSSGTKHWINLSALGDPSAESFVKTDRTTGELIGALAIQSGHVRPASGTEIAYAPLLPLPALVQNFNAGQAAKIITRDKVITLSPVDKIHDQAANGEFRFVGDFNQWSPATGITGVVNGNTVTFDLSALPDGTYRFNLIRFNTGAGGELKWIWVGPFGSLGQGFVKQDLVTGDPIFGLKLEGQSVQPAEGFEIGLAPQQPLAQFMPSQPSQGSSPEAEITVQGRRISFSPISKIIGAGSPDHFVLVGDFNYYRCDTGIVGTIAGEVLSFEIPATLPDGVYRIAFARCAPGATQANAGDYGYVNAFGSPGPGFVKEDTTAQPGSKASTPNIQTSFGLEIASNASPPLRPAPGTSIGYSPRQPLPGYVPTPAPPTPPTIVTSGLSVVFSPMTAIIDTGATGEFVLLGDFNWWELASGLNGTVSGDAVSFDLSSLPPGSYRVNFIRYLAGSSGGTAWGYVGPFGSPSNEGFVKHDLTGSNAGHGIFGLSLQGGQIGPAVGSSIGFAPPAPVVGSGTTQVGTGGSIATLPRVEATGLILSFRPLSEIIAAGSGQYRLAGDYNRWEFDSGIVGTVQGESLIFDLSSLQSGSYRLNFLRRSSSGQLSWGWVGAFGSPGVGFVKRDTVSGGTSFGVTVANGALHPSAGSLIGYAPQLPLTSFTPGTVNAAGFSPRYATGNVVLLRHVVDQVATGIRLHALQKPPGLSWMYALEVDLREVTVGAGIAIDPKGGGKVELHTLPEFGNLFQEENKEEVEAVLGAINLTLFDSVDGRTADQLRSGGGSATILNSVIVSNQVHLPPGASLDTQFGREGYLPGEHPDALVPTGQFLLRQVSSGRATASLDHVSTANEWEIFKKNGCYSGFGSHVTAMYAGAYYLTDSIFTESSLARFRSLVGCDYSGDTLYLLVASSSTLAEAFESIYMLGARNALWADSGGSSALYVPGKLDSPFAEGRSNPHVANALVVYRRKGDGPGLCPPGQAIVLDDSPYREGSCSLITSGGGVLRGGTSTYWSVVSSPGFGGGMHFTRNTRREVDNFFVWLPSIPADGFYRVEVFVPNDHANTRKARYEVRHADGLSAVVIDQSRYFNAWVPLDDYYMRSGFSSYVFLSDATEETQLSREVGFDAVRFVSIAADAAQRTAPLIHSSGSRNPCLAELP